MNREKSRQKPPKSGSRPTGPASTPASKVRVVEIEETAGQRIDNYLVRQFKGVPKSRIYQMIRKGEVRVNGGRIRPTYRLAAGDRVRIPPVRESSAAAPAFIGQTQLAALAAAVLYEDDRLLVLDKPAGLAVHGGSGVSFGAIEALRRMRPGVTLELVHRLDRETSGCLLVAKRRSALRELHGLIRSNELIKTYRLIAHGIWPADLTRIDSPLTRYLTPSGERRVRVDPEGKPSLTTFHVDAVTKGDAVTEGEAAAVSASLLTARLHTGRTHQIRVHCREAGHTIAGDDKYASPEELDSDRALEVRRLCLHASRIEIPWTSGPRVLEAPLPSDFRDAWHRFQRSASEHG